MHTRATRPRDRLPGAPRLPWASLVLGVCTSLGACTPKGDQQNAVAAPSAPPATGAAAVTATVGERPATAGGQDAQSEAYVTQPTFVRRTPSEAREVEVPGRSRRVANWLATLQRGEHVRVLEAREGWLRVQSSDEAAGWLKREGVLVGPEVAQATNLATLQRFTRPDLLALVPTRPIEPGSLLYVLRRKDGFCEVNYAGNAVGWVLADALERDANEVEAAKLLHRARQLQERNDPAGEALLALARQRFAATRLLTALYPPPTPSPVAPDVEAPGAAFDDAAPDARTSGAGLVGALPGPGAGARPSEDPDVPPSNDARPPPAPVAVPVVPAEPTAPAPWGAAAP